MRRKIINYQAVVLILVGVIAIFVTLYLYSTNEYENISLINILIMTVQTLAIALIGFSLFGMLLDTKNWRDYFGERIREVIMQQSYLTSLDNSALKELQVKVLKAFFKDQSIDHEGSFLHYFQTNLHKFISEPYREDVTTEIELRGDDKDCFTIFDRVSYICRKAGGSIQEKISFMPDPGEFEEITCFKVSIKYPYYHDKKGEEKVLYNGDSNNPAELLGKGLNISLKEYKDIDQLTVILESIYKIKKDRFQYWQMAHPTKNFMVILTHDQIYDLQIKPLVLEPENVQICTKERSTTVRCDSWMLPQSGVAWRFKKK